MQHAERKHATSRPALLLAAALLLVGAAGPAVAGETPAPAAQGHVRGADAPGAIDGEYIVVLNESAGPASGSARRASAPALRHLADGLLEDVGAPDARVHRTYGTVLEGFAVTADAAAARRLAALPSVAYVQQNGVEYGDGTQIDPTWGLDRIDQRSLPLDDAYGHDGGGAGVHAYVVDSGVAVGYPAFTGRASDGWDFVEDDGVAQDCHGHGTHVAGTVGSAEYGVAKDVEIVAVRVLDCENSGTTADVLAGYDWVAANAQLPAVANVSIGGSASDVKDAGVRGMVEAGVTVTVSAGNNDVSACLQSPARESSVLTVAATTSSDARWASSNHGSCVDLFAPGHLIESVDLDDPFGSAVWSGTSMAAPHVTGAAALYLEGHPGATPGQVTDALIAGTTKGAVTGAGTGSPNRLLYTRY
ncbi:S8 family peptidase [Streptomyces sp. TR06-5]|uniref:S8 family peptidase n=1 Tax=unclassified Streptomyces TaxID=2593676 RepID=UPI0039A26CAF